MVAVRATDAAPLVEGCVPGEPMQADEVLPPLLAAHLDLIMEKLNAQLREDPAFDGYELVFEATPMRKRR